MRVVPSLTFPIVTLQRLMFDKISMFGRSLALMTTLSETAGWLTNANAKRNELLERLVRLSGMEMAQAYFGNGAANPEYAHALGAVASHTDELIFFSATLASDLAAHARALRAAWIEEFGRAHAPEATAVDFTAARQNGLMPEDSKYAEWLASLDRQIAGDLRA